MGLRRQVVSNTVVRLLAAKMVERRVEIPLEERDLSQPGRAHRYELVQATRTVTRPNEAGEPEEREEPLFNWLDNFEVRAFRLDRPDEAEFDFDLLPNENKEYEARLDEGRYLIHAIAPGYEPVNEVVRVFPGPVALEFKPIKTRKTSLTVHVFDAATGEPLPQTSLRIRPHNSQIGADGLTGEDGTHQYTVAAQEPHIISASKPGYLPLDREILVSKGSRDFLQELSTPLPLVRVEGASGFQVSVVAPGNVTGLLSAYAAGDGKVTADSNKKVANGYYLELPEAAEGDEAAAWCHLQFRFSHQQQLFVGDGGNRIAQHAEAIDNHFASAHEDLNISVSVLFNGELAA